MKKCRTQPAIFTLLPLVGAFLALVACGENPAGPREPIDPVSGSLQLTIEVAVQDIGMPSGITSVTPRSINDEGQVAGEFGEEMADGSRSFFWDGQVFHGLGPSVGGLVGGSAVNDQGQVAGLLNFDFASPFGNAVCHPAIWQDGVVTDLGNLPDGECAEALDINDLGDVVGHDFSDPHGERAFLARGGDIPVQLPDLAPEGRMSIAIGLNDVGDVVGLSRTAEGQVHAVLWRDGEVIDLDALAGALPGAFRSSNALDINNAAQVVGSSYASSTSPERAVLWDNDLMIELGVLPGQSSSQATAINDLGQVVGTSFTEGSAFRQAFVWENGNLTELPPLPGGVSAVAEDINDQGEVVGATRFAGFSRGTIWRLELTPQQQVTSLQADVEQLVITGALSDNDANGLTAKLDRALAALEGSEFSVSRSTRTKQALARMIRPQLAMSPMAVVFTAHLPNDGNSRAAIQQLKAFVDQVEGFVSARKLTPSQGQALIDSAQEIIDRLGG
jgi:probable HAF family extracellular repeat protein